MGELLLIHPPAVVRRLTFPEIRAMLGALYKERARQAELMAAFMGAGLR